MAMTYDYDFQMMILNYMPILISVIKANSINVLCCQQTNNKNNMNKIIVQHMIITPKYIDFEMVNVQLTAF